MVADPIRRVLLVACAIVLFAVPVLAAAPNTYSIVRWTADDGLPTNIVNDIRQTPDGYLWLSTTAGLVRFDGSRFTVYGVADGLAGFRVYSLNVTDEGRIQAVAEDGRIFEVFDEGLEVVVDTGRLIRRVASRDDQMWVAYLELDPELGNVASLSDGALSEPFDGRALTSSPFFLDADGALWTILGGRSARLEGESFVAHEQPYPNSGSFHSGGRPLVLQPSEGRVLLAVADGTRTRFMTTTGESVGSYAMLTNAMPWLIDRYGVLWSSRGAEIFAQPPGGAPSVWRTRFEGGAVPLTMIEDADGTIWVGSSTEGLMRIKPVPFELIGRERGIAEDQVRFVGHGADDCMILFPPGPGGPYVVGPDGRARLANPSDMKSVRTADGYVWRWFGSKLIRESATGSEVVRTDLIERFAWLQLDRRRENVIWWSGVRSTRRIRSDGGTAVVEATYPTREFRQLLQDRDGVVWITHDEGLIRIEDGSETRLTIDDGLPTNQLRAIHQDETGTLWFGSFGAGLIRYRDGRFESLGSKQGLGEDFVTSIFEDAAGNFWMAGNRGIYRAPRSQLEAVFDGRADRVESVSYGRDEGLNNPESSGAPGRVDAQGRFWFPTFDGAVVVDPLRALELGAQPPRVLVDEVLASPAATRSGDAYTLPPNPQRVELRFTAIALSGARNVRFQYRLDGYDDAWIESGEQRSATYTGLGPGDYTFRVRARVKGSVEWSEAAAPLTVAAAFHQQTRFQVALAALLLLLAYAAYRLRVRRLRAHAAGLERVVSERTAELAQERDTVARQVDRLRDAEEARSRFFANVSHEFRTPLTLIQGPLEDFGHGRHGPLSAEAREGIDLATRNSRRLMQLVEQLLGIARAESGRLTLQARRVDLKAFVTDLVRDFQPVAERGGISLTMHAIDAALPVWFDPDHMEKIVTNLVGNALKFTGHGGSVEVHVRSENDRALLEVRDDGPGISAEDLPHVFERFRRATTGSAVSEPGTGIGLALTRELVRVHHGEIDVESRVGEGSRFRVELPLGSDHLDDSQLVSEADAALHDRARELEEQSRLPELEPVPLPAAPAGDDVPSVLIADDHAEIRLYLRRQLSQTYRVVEAADGREALELARQSTPDLIVSDVMMPRMDGVELCEALRADPDLEFVPLILLTAKAGVDSRIEGLKRGADDYVAKPFNVRELQARIDNLIASRRKLRARFEGSPAAIVPQTVQLPPEEDAFLGQVRDAISERLSDETFGVDELAQAVGQSRSTLYRRLKELTERSPMELIRSARLEQAAHALRTGEDSIGEIAYAVGFKSLAYFSSSFKERYGVTPSVYRQDA